MFTTLILFVILITNKEKNTNLDKRWHIMAIFFFLLFCFLIMFQIIHLKRFNREISLMPKEVVRKVYADLKLNLNEFFTKEIWDSINKDKKKIFILSSKQCPFCSDAIEMVESANYPQDIEYIRLEHDYNAKRIQINSENIIEINNMFMDKFPFKDFPTFILTHVNGELIDVTSSPIKVLDSFITERR